MIQEQPTKKGLYISLAVLIVLIILLSCGYSTGMYYTIQKTCDGPYVTFDSIYAKEHGSILDRTIYQGVIKYNINVNGSSDQMNSSCDSYMDVTNTDNDTVIELTYKLITNYTEKRQLCLHDWEDAEDFEICNFDYVNTILYELILTSIMFVVIAVWCYCLLRLKRKYIKYRNTKNKINTEIRKHCSIYYKTHTETDTDYAHTSVTKIDDSSIDGYPIASSSTYPMYDTPIASSSYHCIVIDDYLPPPMNDAPIASSSQVNNSSSMPESQMSTPYESCESD